MDDMLRISSFRRVQDFQCHVLGYFLLTMFFLARVLLYVQMVASRDYVGRDKDKPFYRNLKRLSAPLHSDEKLIAV
jgi:hypothetical protein